MSMTFEQASYSCPQMVKQYQGNNTRQSQQGYASGTGVCISNSATCQPDWPAIEPAEVCWDQGQLAVL